MLILSNQIFSHLPCQTFFFGKGTLEFDRFDEIVEKGYNYAKPLVDEWVLKNPWLIGSNTTAAKTDLCQK